MRKKNFFSTILSLLILIALIACGYIFFKDMDGPSIAIVPDTGRVSPHTPLQITLADPSNIRSISVGVRRNNVVTPIFQRHFEEYLPQRTVEVSLKNAGLREGAFELEIKATDASLAGFGQGNTRTEVLAHASGYPAAAHLREDPAAQRAPRRCRRHPLYHRRRSHPERCAGGGVFRPRLPAEGRPATSASSPSPTP